MTTATTSLRSVLADAESEGLLVQAEGLTGSSGDKLVGLLQRLAKRLPNDACYLEVGVFQGLTLVSVGAAAPDTHVYGIDNFSQFDADGQNRDLVRQRVEHNAVTNTHLIDMDYEDALARLDELLGAKKIGVYFVDGPHDYRSQLVCLELARPFLADDAVIVVDDANYQHVRMANRDFLTFHPEYRLAFETYTAAHPQNMTGPEEADARRGWWNGVNVIVQDDRLSPMYPDVSRDRRLFENEHVTQSARYPEVAPHAALAISALSGGHLRVAASHARRALRASRRGSRGRYVSLNTYSEALATRVNPGLR